MSHPSADGPRAAAAAVPAEARRARLAALVAEDGFVRVTDASELLGVSEVTLRSDLGILERAGELRRVHGGAMPVLGRGRESPVEATAERDAELKRAIGRRAAALVSSGSSILLDVGSTTLAVARALVSRTDLTDLVVVTNGLSIALALEAAIPRFTVIVTGGTLRPLQHSLVNPLAGETLAGLHVDLAILGCNGIDAEGRVTNLNLPEAEVKRAMLGASERRILVADGSKVGQQHLGLIGQLADFSTVITGGPGASALRGRQLSRARGSTSSTRRSPRLAVVSTDALPRTGAQYLLESGDSAARVGSLAGALHAFTVAGADIVEPVDADTVAPMGCGLVLAPWPNRVRDARWEWEGKTQLLDVTEPSLGNASHGLLRNTVYRLLEHTSASVTLGALIAPQHGWPFLLETWVRYVLSPNELTVTHGVTNRSGLVAPWAVGAHPYFRVGAIPSEQLTLTVTGATRLEVDARFNPVAEHPVGGDPTGGDPADSFDLRAGVLAGALDVNTAYGELANREHRADIAWLTAPDAATTTLWADPDFGWLQAYTPANFPRPSGTGFAIALEPMTAPPNALNSGVGIIHLEPGDTWQGSWGVRYSPAGGAR